MIPQDTQQPWGSAGAAEEVQGLAPHLSDSRQIQLVAQRLSVFPQPIAVVERQIDARVGDIDLLIVG